MESFFSFLSEDESSVLYGAVVKDTVFSLLLNILPKPNLEGKNHEVPKLFALKDTVMHDSKSAQLLHTVQKSLHIIAGFCFMEVSLHIK